MNGSYDLRPMPAPVDPALLARASVVQTSTFGHWRLWGMCDGAIAALQPGPTIAGTAVTLALPGPDGALLHHALGLLRPGDVLAIDRLGDHHHACVGGIVARAALSRGVAAIVVDGPVTDITELRAIGLPIWACGTSARTTRRIGLGGRLNAPVSIGGAVVMPGDILLCDADGVVCLPLTEAGPDLDRAAASHSREASIIAALDHGMVLADILPIPPLGAIT
jgi:regulator of RNase E activity RraA